MAYFYKLLFFILFFTFNCVEFTLGQYENAIKNQVIVKLKEKDNIRNCLQTLPPEAEIKVDSKLSKTAKIWLLTFNSDNISLDKVMTFLNRSKSVLYVSPNRKVTLRSIPNDTLYSSQWQHDAIQSESAWDITTGGTTADGSDIVVALIESADLKNHEDLKDNHWINTNEIPNNSMDDDGNGYIDDYNGWNVSTLNDNIGSSSHGTSCAGIMGAKGNNTTGVTGINWDLKIMNIAGYTTPFTEANIIASYDYALNARLLWNSTNGAEGAFVVATNSSWGINGGQAADYPIWCDFYNTLGEAGILSVNSTTNLDQNIDINGDMPSTCNSEYLISVTATDAQDKIDFAGFGTQHVDVAAPGSLIYTTGPNNTYITTSGTSFASPLTSGLIGLMYSIPCPSLESLAKANPSGTALEVKASLLNGVDKSLHLQAKTSSGGRINSRNAIDRLSTRVCNICIPPNNVQLDSIDENVAHLSYNSQNGASQYQVNYKAENSNTWSSYITNDSNFVLSNLTKCTSYEFSVASICNGFTGPSSQAISFTTKACGDCLLLPYCENSAKNDVTPKLKIQSPAHLSGDYNFQGTTNFGGSISDQYISGELILANDGTASAYKGCNPLLNTTEINGNIAVVERGDCNYTVKAMNAQLAGATAIIVINDGPGTEEMGGVNNNIVIPAIMISQSDGSILKTSILNGEQPNAFLGTQNEWIEEFQINGNNFATGDNEGYIFNDNSFILNKNQNIPFISTLGFDGPVLNEYLRIWIDFDQNGVFDNNELLFDDNNNGLGIISGDFIIPNSALIGNTRMRIQLLHDSVNPIYSSCGDYFHGEVEDYCIEIKSGDICNFSIQSNVTPPLCNELKNGAIDISVSGAIPGYTYSWNNGSNSASINNLPPGNYELIIQDASGCDTTLFFPISYEKHLEINENISLPNCPNQNDGSISVNATGGSNFDYQWSNGPQNNLWSQLGPGKYQITATDIDGCKVSETYTIYDPNLIPPLAAFTNDNYFLTLNFFNQSTQAISYIWDFGDGNHSTEFEPTHSYTTEGVYNVCLSAVSTCDTSVICKAITVENDDVGVNKEETQSITIYPNPASDQLTIIKNNTEITKGKIYNSVGKLIKEVNLKAEETVFSVSKMAKGIYTVHLLNDDGTLLHYKQLVLF